MAVLALGFAGQFIGASIGGSILGVTTAAIGGFVGSTIGSYVDNLLFNSGQHTEGPRLDDLTVTASTVGNPIPLCYGPENRIAGNIIWSSGLIETATTRTEGGKGGGPSVEITEYSYRVSLAIGLCQGVIADVEKVWANGKLIFDRASAEDAGLWGAFRVYTGTLTQTPDPTMEAYVGVGETPAYVDLAYVVIEDLQLADFGNGIPNLEFLVNAGSDTLPGVVRDIIARCGLNPNYQSVGSLSGPIRGYTIGRPSTGLSALQPLAMAYRFNVAEHSGDLRISYRDSAPLSTIPLALMAGHKPGLERPEPVTWTRALESSLPRSAALKYPDPERDWQVNAQARVRGSGSGDSQNDLTAEVSVVLTDDEAMQVTDSLLWEAWLARETGRFTSDDRLLEVVVDRAYWMETPGGYEALTITRKTRGVNGLIEFECVRNRLDVYGVEATGQSAPSVQPLPQAPGESELILLDIPILLDADDNPGFYWAVVGSGGWRGADLKRALDILGPYTQVEPQGLEATVGDVVGTMGAGPDDVQSDEVDTTTVLTVDLRHSGMELSSADAEAIAAGANAAYVGPADGHGGEIIQFETATPTGGTTYQLTDLLRGRKGTEFARGDHGAGEIFVLLERGPIKRANFGTDDLGVERYYKAVSLLTTVADADAVPFTNTGVGLRPYAPIFLEVFGDTGDDLDLTWTRRSRIGEGIDPPPLGEQSELYVVRIMNAAGTVIVREVEVTEPTFTYTAAMQTADFGGVVSDLRWRVAQVSATFGPGIFAELYEPV